MQTDLRQLPSVDRLLSDARIKEMEHTYSRSLALTAARRVLDDQRAAIGQGGSAASYERIIELVAGQMRALGEPSLVPVINATGVVLHTNLGRAPLSFESLQAMSEVSANFNNLEFELSTGKRGSRQVHVNSLVCQLTGAEDALVVNNNAAAVLLALSALAKRKEVVTSRGQAVEIGGSFRIPDVMRQSGARLVEVGTTNCTYLQDYEQAITPRTAALLRVHSSNFRIVGFTQEVPLADLVGLAERHGLLALDDLGSGCLLDTSQYGLAYEPTVSDSISAGVSLAFFSGDKLLGGPQAGIIVGRRDLVEKLRRHPLARAVRIDKVRLAGLARTLLHYVKEEATEKIPIWRMISTPLIEIEKRARAWALALDGLAAVVPGESVVGGGSLPGSTLPTRLVAIKGSGRGKESAALQKLAAELRACRPPVVGRIEGNALLLDPRTVLPEQDLLLISCLREVSGRVLKTQERP